MLWLLHCLWRHGGSPRSLLVQLKLLIDKEAQESDIHKCVDTILTQQMDPENLLIKLSEHS